MKWEIKSDEKQCPNCGKRVQLEEYLDTSCPHCNHGCVWTKQYSDDLSNSWDLFMWDDLEKQHG